MSQLRKEFSVWQNIDIKERPMEEFYYNDLHDYYLDRYDKTILLLSKIK